MTNDELIQSTRDAGLEPLLDLDGNVIGATKAGSFPSTTQLKWIESLGDSDQVRQ